MPGFDEGLTLRSGSGGFLTSPTALSLACHVFVRLHGFVRGAVQRSIDVSSQAAAVESPWALVAVVVMMLPLVIVEQVEKASSLLFMV